MIHNTNNRVGGGNQRVIGLDYLRISLALLIFLFHSHVHVLHCDYGFLNGFVDMGAIAMTGFFLLSGYTLNLTNRKVENVGDIKKFYLKRLISILPLYYAWALVNIGQNILFDGMNAVVEELVLFPIEALGIQSVYATLFPFSHNGGSWFISCILICYFVYPLIQTLTKSLTDRARLRLILILGAILLWSPFVQHYFDLQTIYSNPFFRVCEFSIGILVSQMNVQTQTENKLILLLRKPLVCVLSFICLVAGVSIGYYIGIAHDYMLYSWVALPCFISLLVSLGYLNFKSSRVLQYLSNISFSIFLSQLIVVWYGVKFILGTIGCESNMAKIILSAVVCLGIANFFHYCIEKPSTKYLKAKFL